MTTTTGEMNVRCPHCGGREHGTFGEELAE